jgi:hypothetical protein
LEALPHFHSLGIFCVLFRLSSGFLLQRFWKPRDNLRKDGSKKNRRCRISGLLSKISTKMQRSGMKERPSDNQLDEVRQSHLHARKRGK